MLDQVGALVQEVMVELKFPLAFELCYQKAHGVVVPSAQPATSRSAAGQPRGTGLFQDQRRSRFSRKFPCCEGKMGILGRKSGQLHWMDMLHDGHATHNIQVVNVGVQVIHTISMEVWLT